MTCCFMMVEQVEFRCDQHPDLYDCPDSLVAVTSQGYGLRIHDGGGSYMQILYCPWCGERLKGDKTACDRLSGVVRRAFLGAKIR